MEKMSKTIHEGHLVLGQRAGVGGELVDQPVPAPGTGEDFMHPLFESDEGNALGNRIQAAVHVGSVALVNLHTLVIIRTRAVEEVFDAQQVWQRDGDCFRPCRPARTQAV